MSHGVLDNQSSLKVFKNMSTKIASSNRQQSCPHQNHGKSLANFFSNYRKEFMSLK